MPSVVVVNTPNVAIQDAYGNGPTFIRNDAAGINRLAVDANGSNITADGYFGLAGIEDIGNSTITPLGSDEVFTGTAFDTLNYSSVVISAKPDQASAASGMSLQWSPDGTNWDVTSSSSFDANQGRGFHVNHRGRYFRIVYTNGPIAQGSFRLNAHHHPTASGLITRPLADEIDDDNYAQIVRAVLNAKTPDGSYTSAAFDGYGRLIVIDASATADTKGFSDGRAVLSTTTVSAVRETTYTEQSSNAQRSISSSSVNDTSAGTGARVVRITYFTSDFVGPITESVTLNGTSAVNTVGTDICYIEKMEVLTAGSGGSNAGTISLFASTGGGGGTVWSIAIGSNKTFGAHHYVASGKTCFITGILVGIKGADTTGGFLRYQDLTTANAAERQISDTIRAPSSGQSFRAYGTPIEVAHGSRITGMVAPDSTSSRTYYLSFDFYEE